MPNDTNSLAHTKWNCRYHIVFARKYRRKVFYCEKREHSVDRIGYIAIDQIRKRQGIGEFSLVAAMHHDGNVFLSLLTESADKAISRMRS